jgi:hypothetical protein
MCAACTLPILPICTLLHAVPVLLHCTRSKSPAAQVPSDSPSAYRLIVGFEEFGPDSGSQHKVLLREWTPQWAAPGGVRWEAAGAWGV